MSKRMRFAPLAFGLTALLAGCGDDSSNESTYQTLPTPAANEHSSIFSGGGLSLFGTDTTSTPSGDSAPAALGVGVNAFLWRASLDTVSFMPIASADPFGGVIITDWYTPSEAPTERMKVQVTILDRELRADGVRVAVFKQQANAKAGGWVDAPVDPHTNTDIENAILTRARQLRIAQGGS